MVVLLPVYKNRLILNTLYICFAGFKRKQALLESNLPGITPVDEVNGACGYVISLIYFVHFA
jgi:hypothetical protein